MVRNVFVWKTFLFHVTIRTDVLKNVVGVHVNENKWPGLQAHSLFISQKRLFNSRLFQTQKYQKRHQ